MVITIVNTVVGIIGIIVGVIGWKSLNAAIKIKNSAKAENGSTINQGNTYNNYGISEDTVRLIAKNMTKEEMCQLIIRLIPINTDDEHCIGNRLRTGDIASYNFEKILDAIPTTYYGKTTPSGFSTLKDGDIWHKIG